MWSSYQEDPMSTTNFNSKSLTNFWKKRIFVFETILSRTILFLIGLYRTIGTTFLGGSCRFEPSCSCYAAEAVRIHKPFKAIQLILCRLGRCHPWGNYGYDPVPPRKGK